MPQTFYLLDGHALAYRAFFALMATGSRFQTRSGEPTAGTFGFANILMRILEQEKPEYLAVAFDTGKTFRNEAYPAYKATREKMPDDLVPQITRIRQLVDAFGLPRLEMEGYEADDVLGSAARQAVRQGLGVKIITGDRDLLQLVDDRVIINLTGAKMAEARDYFAEDVKTSLGVAPNQVVDLKALIGDTSDNIPGVKGIGPKTAISLLTEYPTLDEVYAHLDSIPERTRKLLEEGKPNAYLSYDLARIRTDLNVSLDLDQARVSVEKLAGAAEMLRELEFRSLLSRLQAFADIGGVPISAAQPSLFVREPVALEISPQYELPVEVVDSTEKLINLTNQLKQTNRVAFDTETTSTDPMRAKLVGISLALKTGQAFYIPVGHETHEPQLSLSEVVRMLKPFFENSDLKKIGHHAKYDMLVLRRHGMTVEGLDFDTMVAAWVADPASHRLGLKDLAEIELGISMTNIEALIGSGSKQRAMSEVSIKDAAPYAGADAEVTFQLAPILQKRLEKLDAIDIFQQMEMPLIPVLADMEFTGISVDVPFLQNYARDLKARMNTIEKDIYEIVGAPLNLNSTQQLSKALFETLHLTPPDSGNRTKAGNLSTAAGVLEEMRGQHPVVDLLLEYRELSKLVSTYLEALPRQVNPETGRVHTSFSQTGSVTGRLASSDPNLQNIPTRTEMGNQVRKGFVGSPGQVLLSVDYSQIELRIVAHLSGDQAMLNAFRSDQDIHTATAAAIYGVPLSDVTKEQRRHAKAINFGLMYGMSAFGLSRSADLTLAEAENFVKAYFEQFPAVKAYLDNIRKQAARDGFVQTMFGRKRYFPNLQHPPTQQMRMREEREAINAPIQGTAADMIKRAMLQLPEALRSAGLKAKILLQVHDELVLECPRDELQKTAFTVRQVMESAGKLDVPLSTDASWGVNWAELTDLNPD